MKTIETVLDIDAPVEIVWHVLTDFQNYEKWNPFIIAAEGRAEVGASLRLSFSLADRKPRTFTPTVTAAEPRQRLAWHGRLAVPKLFDADHGFVLHAHGAHTTVVHREDFRGALVPFARRTIAATDHAFLAMDDALSRRAASIAARGSALG